MDKANKKGRRRNKLNHITVSMRMSPNTKKELEKLAKSYGCLYGDEAWIAGLLRRIADKELLVVPPSYIQPLINSNSNQ